jgi:hypothetical protein
LSELWDLPTATPASHRGLSGTWQGKSHGAGGDLTKVIRGTKKDKRRLSAMAA